MLPQVQEVFDAARTGAGDAPLDEAGVLDDVLTALTREIRLMLDEGVVETASQIDTAMILGAGWPFHLGGSRRTWTARATPSASRVPGSTSAGSPASRRD
ncbi:hypothetical protein GCM10025875_14120 [Litorihabitans aurantiacus]|uniref:3-hydroxyacyl-CoA dehydrogenase C-terminal domain-containing protein n=1 Tax=Litorihabitans aurantiacus TaxID=1930061 RepID=A0AA38CTG4_9MICO|nr:hypothetical protein GCM10025875_14120 [Litorihabitans aurantiacus]